MGPLTAVLSRKATAKLRQNLETAKTLRFFFFINQFFIDFNDNFMCKLV